MWLRSKAFSRSILTVWRLHESFLTTLFLYSCQQYGVCWLGAGGDKIKVGICHNVWWLEPKSGGPLYVHTKCADITPKSSCEPRPLLIYMFTGAQLSHPATSETHNTSFFLLSRAQHHSSFPSCENSTKLVIVLVRHCKQCRSTLLCSMRR